MPTFGFQRRAHLGLITKGGGGLLLLLPAARAARPPSEESPASAHLDVRLQGLEFGRVARPEGQGQGDGAFVLIFDGEDLAVLTGPELIGMHF